MLTFSSMASDGQARRPSGLIGDVRRLFPDLKILEKEQVSWPIQSEREGMRRLIKGLTDSQETGMASGNQEFEDVYKRQALRLQEAAELVREMFR